MQAHEYMEDDAVLREKVQLLAKLLKKSKHTLAYTGAGISTSAGVDDYATKHKKEKMGRPKSPFDALPTKAHRVMAAMHKHGDLNYWIQQNHDGANTHSHSLTHTLTHLLTHSLTATH